MNEPTTLEWIYTLKKSVISKAFDQPINAWKNSTLDPHSKQKRARYKYCTIRYGCIDHFFLWIYTKEGYDFWSEIASTLLNEIDNDTNN